MYYGVRRFTYVGLPHLPMQSFIIAVITHILCVGTPIALANYKAAAPSKRAVLAAR